MPQLERIFLTGTKVTDAGVAELKKAKPKCRIYKVTPRSNPLTPSSPQQHLHQSR